MPDFSIILDGLLKKNSLGWYEFGRMIGAPRASMWNYKHGTIPKVEVLEKMAATLGTSIDYLLKGSGPAPELVHKIEPPGEAHRQFALRLSGLMDKNKISASQLAREIGVKRAVVSNWMRARNFPSDSAGRAAAKILGVSFDFLVTGKEIERHEVIYAKPVPAQEKCQPDNLEKFLKELTADPEVCSKVMDYFEFLRAQKSRPRQEEAEDSLVSQPKKKNM